MASLGPQGGAGSTAVLLFMAVLVGISHGSFLLLMPNEFHLGWPLHVSSTVHKSQGPVNVSVSLLRKTDGHSVAADSGVLRMGETKMMTLMVGHDLETDVIYAVRVMCSGGLVYSQEKAISLNLNSSIVLVQTDKAIYKPDQLVRIRAATLDPIGLSPVKKPVIITIIDPNDNKVEQFTNMTSIMGVTETDFKLSRYSLQGQWRVQVEDDSGLFYNHRFKVEEYVLPKFSVDLKVDQQYLVQKGGSLPEPTVEVTAKYTYGEGVQGKCDLSIKVEGTQAVDRYSAELLPGGSVTFQDIDWQALRSRARSFPGSVTVVANVTDVTGRSESDQFELLLMQNNIKLEILDSSTMVLRNGLPAEVKLSVTDLANSPVSGAEVEVKIVTGKEIQVFKEVLEPGQTEMTFSYTAEWKDRVSLGSQGELQARVVNFPGVSTNKKVWIYVSGSPKSSAVQIKLNNFESTSETLKYDILSTSEPGDLSTLSYVVINKGNIITAGQPSGDSIQVTPTLDMCPDANLLVYLMIGSDTNAEAVVDMVTFKPAICYTKQVSVSFNTVEARVQTNVDMSMAVQRVDQEKPGIHEVFYLGVDKSVILLQGRTDIGDDELVNSMRKLNEGNRAKMRSEFLAEDWEPHSAGGFLKGTGLLGVHHKVLIQSDLETTWQDKDLLRKAEVPMAGGRPVQRANVEMVEDERSNVAEKSPDKPAAQSPVKTVRKDFPDTWLWGHITTDINGFSSRMVKLPDTITTWVVSAFAMNEDGLAVSKAPAEVRAFQTFFLSMNLPYSIKRGEIFVLRCTVFNYRKKTLQTVVSLKAQPGQFEVVEMSPSTGGLFLKDLELEPKLASSVEFKIKATTVGKIDLEVTATDNVDGQMDEVIKKLLVKPEGVERSRSICRVMDSATGEPVTSTFNLDWPDNVVPDSKRVEVKVTGDVFGQALSNLDSLVMQPVGCGEQNMITTVPNIMGLSYIERTDQQGMDDLAESLRRYAKYGYQRQLNYRHTDGSFSAWGERKDSHHHPNVERKPGSTWLTAFVIKSFSLASKYILVGSDVLAEGIEFIKDKQLTTGEFEEKGTVIHQEMTSGTDSGPGLTVYCLISMLETARALGNDVYDLSQSIKRATTFIRARTDIEAIKSKGNKFMAAMTAYALSLLPNPDAETVSLRDRLLEAVMEMGAPWKPTEADDTAEKRVDQGAVQGSYIRPTQSHELEVGAYVLLTYVNTGRLIDGMSIMKWLQSMQNSRGGYASTQDTVMVLQALSSYGEFFAGKTPSARVTVTEPGSGNSTEIDVSGIKAALLQTYYLSTSANTVEVTLEGEENALAVVKVVYIYYTAAGEDDKALPIKTYTVAASSQRTSASTHRVTACVKSLEALKDPGMTVTTLTLPSGERSMDDIETMMAYNSASRIEVEEETQSIHFYTTGPPKTENCFKANIESDVVIMERKPGNIKTYSYYSPENMEEVALDLNQACQENCGGGTGSAVALHVANLLLTVLICTLATLLLCM